MTRTKSPSRSELFIDQFDFNSTIAPRANALCWSGGRQKRAASAAEPQDVDQFLSWHAGCCPINVRPRTALARIIRLSFLLRVPGCFSYE